eukprot:CAMPEP_0117009080 /NCGR_PEP_ID=MMETSP0472-20121206/8353_1 /TAXON_ID=693140 ORGANISM="Tiarina fusus, Strain LIS" /NCGR_SAMPLE_ID=MMETSP0472 /ASSEMBLY_ACC=CAM_ASM_000603 /LENGTH=104 /DNA_ID=CAMNT_0004711277 /DNA_START=248 /DNA_END=562 /DNA_ORIENTATION=-
MNTKDTKENLIIKTLEDSELEEIEVIVVEEVEAMETEEDMEIEEAVVDIDLEEIAEEVEDNIIIDMRVEIVAMEEKNGEMNREIMKMNKMITKMILLKIKNKKK